MKSTYSNNLFHIVILGILLFSLSFFTNRYYLTESASCKNWDLQFKKESPVIGKIVILMNALWGSKLSEASSPQGFNVKYVNRSLLVSGMHGFSFGPHDFVISVNGYPVDFTTEKRNEGGVHVMKLGVIPLGDSIIKVEYKGDDVQIKQELNCMYLPVKK